MCRLYGFRANEETKVECTLVHAQNALMLQSRADMLGHSHPDGWGIAYYHNAHPELERRAMPAFEDLFFSETAERIFTQTVVAHIRLATVGVPSLVNSHPFTHGVWAFAHNGTLRGFDRLREELIAETHADLRGCRAGTTDSEHAFYWLLTRMARAGIHWTHHWGDASGLGDVLAASVEELAERCAQVEPKKPAKLNFLVTDGRILVAARWNNSLYWVVRDGIRDCEICGIPHVHHDTGTRYRAIVVASEPVTHENWREVPNRTVLMINSQVEGWLRPIATPHNKATSALH